METNSFDAIVVGSGMSGGWAAKELTEKGLKTLVLERGRMVRHPDYPTATKDPWDLPYGNRITQETRQRKYVWARTGYPAPANEQWFVDDIENPYGEEQRVDWLRAGPGGGRSMRWGRLRRVRKGRRAHGTGRPGEPAERHGAALPDLRARPGAVLARRALTDSPASVTAR